MTAAMNADFTVVMPPTSCWLSFMSYHDNQICELEPFNSVEGTIEARPDFADFLLISPCAGEMRLFVKLMHSVSTKVDTRGGYGVNVAVKVATESA